MSEVQVTVEYFAQARAAAGDRLRETVAIAGGSSLADLVRWLAQTHGSRMQALLLGPSAAVSPSIIIAVNGVQASPGDDVRLHGGETVMIMPPISGGQP
jgi:molybdopterin converting factor small subunit